MSKWKDTTVKKYIIIFKKIIWDYNKNEFKRDGDYYAH